MRYAMGKFQTQSGLPHLSRIAVCPGTGSGILSRAARLSFLRSGSVVLAALVALAVPSAQAFSMHPHRPGHSEQQQVIQVDDLMRTALMSSDAGALDHILAEDFLGISANGTLSDKQQYLQQISRREHQFSRISIEDRKVRLQSSSAVVVTTANVVGKFENTPINGVFRYTRVYSREPDGSWKLRNFEATRVSGSSGDEMRHGVPVTRSR